jgi:hypothetical protein
MQTTIRAYVRTGIVGAWAVFLGFAVALTASRLLAIVDPEAMEMGGLARAGLPLSSLIWHVLQRLYDGGAASVVLGIVLVLVGWFLVLRAS